MRTQIATRPGSPDQPNEDFALAERNVAVVVDGLTARSETGCRHGIAWFAKQLAQGVLRAGRMKPREALRTAIFETASLHALTCDLTDPATPCAAVGIVQVGEDQTVHYLVLGDVSIVLAGNLGERVVSDHRIRQTARSQRAEADSLPHGSDAKSAALARMKKAEIDARNKPGGYWIAGADPAVADHALVGELPLAELTDIALLSDGAARAVDLFRIADWHDMLDLLRASGPLGLIERVRAVELSDRDATRWPRNKVSDDATVIYLDELHERG